MPKGSDKTLYDKMVKALASHAHFAATTDRTAGSTASPATGGGLFTIKHYAGDVTYSPAHLLEKNKDQLYRDLIELCGASSQPFVAGLFPEAREKAGTQRRPVTAGSQFRTQINALVDTLLQCEPHRQSGRLGGAIAGQQGLIRLNLKASGCPQPS